jgi:CrcB protein
MIKWIYLIIGSVGGGVARYSLAGAIYRWVGTDFPYGTIVVNITGCLLIGFFNSLAEVKFVLGTNERVLLMTGFCGAYTTFSTFIFETSNLMKDGEVGRALINVGASLLAGFVLFRIGEMAGRVI